MTHTMNMTYRSKKQVIKEMARVWLETAYSEITARASRDYVSCLTSRNLVMTLLLLMVGVNTAWAQEPKVANGIYYIKNNNPGDWYLWRSVVHHTSGRHYLTTFNGIEAPAVPGKYEAHSKEYCHWIVKNVIVSSNNYIQLINAKTGKYIIRRKFPKTPNTKQNSYGDRDVWLDDLPADEDLAYSYFNLANDNSPYKISYPGNDSYSFNSAVGDDKAGLGSGSGTDLTDQRPSLIQLYSGGTPTWTFTADRLDAPSINFNDSEGSYTITTTLSDVFKIRYTTDGSDPVTDPNQTAQTYVGPDPVVVEQNGTVKAVVVMFVDDHREHDIQLTEVASQEVHTATPPAPTFEVTCDDKLQINCSVSTAKLYYTYTTDNTEPANPTNANTEWTEPVSLPDGAKVKAIAYNASIASEVSDVYTLIHNTASPTITLEATKATITFGSGITIHYTTNGTAPNPEDEGVTASPFEITGLNENTDVDIRVIATSEGRGNSCPVTVKKRPRKPALSVTSECGGTRTHQLTFSGVRSGHTYWYALSNGSNQPAPALDTFTEYTPGSPVEVSTILAWNGTDIWVTLHSYSKDEEGNSSAVVSTNYLLKYTEAPTITSTTNANDITINISAVSGATIRYRVDDGAVVNATTSASFTVSKSEKHVIAATAQYGEEGESCEAIKTVIVGEKITTLSQLKEMTLDGAYVLAANIEMDESYTSKGTADNPFTGVFDGAGYTISGLKQPLFGTAQNAIIHDVNLKSVSISKAGDVGAIVCDAKGYTRIYNCGILPTTANFPEGTHSSVVATGNNGCAGSLVGKLEDDSRVVNCFSYADVTSTGMAAGIVGNNTYASNAAVSNNKYHKLKTMVVNCMFYGNASGSNVYPVYGGQKISNKGDNAINNYNFYSLDCTFTGTFADYCSWPAKKEYLKRYEYHRYLLNSNRELCGWWVGADNAPSTMTTAAVQAVPKDASMMAKWVLDPSVAPYPILKPFGYYSSPINIDADASWRTTAKEWEGKKLGSISVTIDPGDHAVGVSKTSPTDYVVTDMDTLRADYCYRKIQLPYYNKVFGNHNGTNWNAKYAGNYTEWVVTGWEITSTNGADGTFLPNWQTGYNFADRNGSEKDKQRIFAQGGYYYVPNDVTSITIKAHWGRAIYLDNADHSYDRVTMSTAAVENEKGSPGKAFAPAGTRSALGNGQPVYTDKISKVATDHITSTNVYDNAIVLVGNHQYRTGDESLANKDCGFTIMSADLDFDSEPDYCLIWQLGNQTSRYDICPIRFDFLPVTEIGMAMKEDGSLNYYSLGCYRPLGHFEVTETSLIHFGQFEYGNKDRTIEAPLILNGGIYDQYCKGTAAYTTANDYINYIILGGNVYMPSFTPGAHVRDNANYPTRHCAVNVIGGRINNLYLTGNFNDKVTPNTDSPHCYIDGGSFKQVAAAAKEGINGDVTFIINHSKIEEFYGGSTLADKLVTGNIEVTIDNSIVTKYCGGPKFGNMNLNDTDPTKNKTVKTKANNTVFTNYYGGGNGGTSYVQYKSTDETIVLNTPSSTYDWASKGDLNNYTPGKYRSGDGNKNYMADYEMEIVNSSAGTDSKKAVFRTYFYAAQFSATNTGPITNELKNCKVLKNFYGAGNLGGVKGNVKSTLENTEVEGSVFGAGYSASVPEVRIYDKTKRAPTINLYTGIITPTPEGNGDYTAYTWTNKTSLGNQTLSTENPMVKNVGGKNYFFTEESLQDLGTVTGNVKLEIKGSTKVHGKVFDEHGNEVSESIDRGGVFGGGDASDVTGNTWVEMKNGTVEGSVFGGANLAKVTGDTRVDVSGGTIGKANAPKYEALVGNVFGGGKGSLDIVSAGLVTGNTSVTISGNAASPFIYHNIYGGGAYGSVGTFSYDGNTGLPTLCADNTGLASVTITGGIFGTNGQNNGMIFGSSRGDVAVPSTTDEIDPNDRFAWVKKTEVTIGEAEKGVLTSGNGKFYEYPLIRGSVYGSGENGHTLQNTEVKVHNGTIGIESGEEVSYNGLHYDGFRYPMRGNVYGGGCGTDTYEKIEEQKTKIFYNFNAGIVKGNTEVTIDGGHIVHNVYGGGAMGSVGTYTFDTDKTNDIEDGMPISCAANTGKCKVVISGGSIGMANMQMEAGGGPDDAGHVFGAGRGEARNPLDYLNVKITAFYDMTDVTIKKSALVMGSVYGGSESGHVLHDTSVKIEGGQIGLGANMSEAYTEDQWASSDLAPTNHWTYVDDGDPYDPYADDYGNYANQVSARGGNRKGTDGHTFYGNVFAGGSGYYPYAQGKWLFSAGCVGGNATLKITGGHILNNVYGGCEMSNIGGTATVTMSGGTVGVPRPKQKILFNPTIGHIFGAGMGDKRTFFNEETNVNNTSVNVTGGRIYGSVHGGGEDGHVLNLAETTISQANNEVPTIIGSVTNGGTSGFDGNVFGGGQGSPTALTAGTIGGNVKLTILGGTMYGSVYGGGRIASVGTFFRDPDSDEYGKMQEGESHGYITVNLIGGTIHQSVYGGCMGTRGSTAVEQVRFAVSKDVKVNLNGIKAEDYKSDYSSFMEQRGDDAYVVKDNAKGCIVKGNIFGCNNVNSSPQQNVTVHIYATQSVDANRITNPTEGEQTAKVKERYDVNAVYGGGNMAAYLPKGPNATDNNDNYGGKSTTYSTHVIIDGCDRTSIRQVYGGGNAAPTPATEVTVNGTYEIDELFGGGNGADQISYDEGTTMLPNPGANVGFYDYSAVEDTYDTKEKRTQGESGAAFIAEYVYGTGKAAVNVFGGLINHVFGGSNTKGNVRETALTMLEEVSEGGTPVCPFHVNEVYGGGKSALMDAEAKLFMSCIPGLEEVYGGAQAADIHDDVTLTITNGTFKRIFGGNNISGTISGSITVNIEEVGCRPIIIGELYGGGNLAAYSIYGYDDEGNPRMEAQPNENPFRDPEVNVKSFTSIGSIYGGGYGEGALMVGSPTVNINEVADPASVAQTKSYVDNNETKYYSDYAGEIKEIDGHNVVLPSHDKGKMGSINNVFGGGNAAKVQGNATVNIGTAVGDVIYLEIPVKVGDTLPADCYTKNGNDYTEASGLALADTEYYKKYTVLGVDIRGNVFGGGNEAEVTGNTKVKIGKERDVTPAPEPQPNPAPQPTPAPQP